VRFEQNCFAVVELFEPDGTAPLAGFDSICCWCGALSDSEGLHKVFTICNTWLL